MFLKYVDFSNDSLTISLIFLNRDNVRFVANNGVWMGQF